MLRETLVCLSVGNSPQMIGNLLARTLVAYLSTSARTTAQLWCLVGVLVVCVGLAHHRKDEFKFKLRGTRVKSKTDKPYILKPKVTLNTTVLLYIMSPPNRVR